MKRILCDGHYGWTICDSHQILRFSKLFYLFISKVILFIYSVFTRVCFYLNSILYHVNSILYHVQRIDPYSGN